MPCLAINNSGFILLNSKLKHCLIFQKRKNQVHITRMLASIDEGHQDIGDRGKNKIEIETRVAMTPTTTEKLLGGDNGLRK